ncbi:MAG: hypothetical protein ACRD1H_11520, partial [Vicinamibacterales bacterium]
PFEDALAASLARHAASADGTGDAYAIADGMLEARRKRRFRIGLASASGVLAAAVLAGVAVGPLIEPSPLVGPQPAESLAPSPEATPTTTPTPTPQPTPPPTQEAPEACGFPDGTALSYAARSTTAALDVQEVVGDPMSDEPADIYITRDAFEQGELHGRLVCAIFVNQPDFVEITVHPEDGGRYSPAPVPTAPEPSDGISRDEAVAAARDALPDGADWEVVVTEAGPLGRIYPLWATNDWSRDLSGDLWVWRVFLVSGDRGADVVIDYVGGSVYVVSPWIVN